MKTSALLAASVAVLLILPVRADAQQIHLQIQDGLVTLNAQNVSVRQILAEWARIGGARIVNGEKVMGGPVTIQLNRVPERQALDTILRGVSGYMLAGRQASGAGASGFDRIFIMPTSSAPRSNTVPNTAPFAARPMPGQPAPEPVEADVVEDEDGDEPDADDPEVADEGGEEPVTQPQPGMNRPFQRPNFPPNPLGVRGQQRLMPQGVFPGPQQQAEDDEEAPPAQPTTNPLNVPPGASATPGVISPPPPQDPQGGPSTRPRRPPR